MLQNMKGINTSIYLHHSDREWLDRKGKGQRSAQLRADIEELRRLYSLAESQPHIPIKDAIELARRPAA